jgi:hypothetical protein
MKYEEETRARNLYDILTQELATSSLEAEISIEGRGVHWTCTAKRGKRRCSISPLHGPVPVYFVGFGDDTQTQAMGRTPVKKDAVSAMRGWLQGQERGELCDRFEFIDREKRSLERIEKEIIETYPEFEQLVTTNLNHLVDDLYELWLSAKDRTCRVFYFGQNKFPDYVFHWDECRLFTVQTGQFSQLALVLKRWLCDYIMPSDLEREFPWIDTGKLAKHYEAGRGIEGEFVASWDHIERFYGKMVNVPFGSEVLDMIAQMRRIGYDKTLRAGQSMYSFIVSRSRRHGLRTGQTRIVFDFCDNTRDNAMDVSYITTDGEKKLSCSRIAYTSQIDALMKRLEAEDID